MYLIGIHEKTKRQDDKVSRQVLFCEPKKSRVAIESFFFEQTKESNKLTRLTVKVLSVCKTQVVLSLNEKPRLSSLTAMTIV